MGDATRPGCNEVSGTKTGVFVDGVGTIDDNEPREAEGEIDIIAREKQTDTNSEIYYAMHPSKNKTPTTPNKTNKTVILISSQLNV